MRSSSDSVWRLPPRIKVYEALGAIADGRVRQISEGDYSVVSSDGTRYYHVIVRPDNRHVESDDNGSRYKGYLGYPAISVLMLRGALPYDPNIAKELKGIPWKRLNERFGRYDLTEKWVLDHVTHPNSVKSFVDTVMEVLRSVHFYRLGGVQQTLF